jgi:ATP-dependent Clp protease adaptor protein ClpS
MKKNLPIVLLTAQVEVQEQTVSKVYLLPRYKVILHNDNHNEAGYVARSLAKAVPSLSYEQAWQIMLQAHTTGFAVVVVCPKEAAEYYQERLQGFGLTVTIEPE